MAKAVHYMNNVHKLIYSIFFDIGDNKFSSMMPMVAHSIRRFGKFKGDIIFATNCVDEELKQNVEEFGVDVISYQPELTEGWGVTAEKFSFFSKGPSDYDRILFIDADTLIINPIEPLFQIPRQLVLINSGSICKIINGGQWFSYDKPETSGVYSGYILGNSGILSTIFDACLEKISEQPNEFMKHGDQAVLNWVLQQFKAPIDCELLKATCMITDYLDRLPPEVINDEKVFFKHYYHFRNNIPSLMKQEIELLEGIRQEEK